MTVGHPDERVVILAPVGRDASVIGAVLTANGVASSVCVAIEEACRRMLEGAAAVVLTDEALEGPDLSLLLQQLRQQPPWSELPLVILTRGGEPRVARLLELVASAAGGVTLLERPIGASTLLRAVDVALRSRRRQYQVRDLLQAKAHLSAIVESSDEAMRIAGHSFRQLVEQSPFGVYAVDADFRLVLVSAGAQAVFANVKPLLGRDFEDVFRCLWPDPFASEALQRFRDTLATGQPYHSRRTVERRADSGATEAYDWKIERMVLPDGRLGVVCHFYDLSERQRYEAELRASEHRYRALLDATSAVTWTCPPSGLHVTPQPTWMAFTGQTAEEMLGDGWIGAVHPDDAEGAGARWADAVARGVPYQSEHRLRRRDGQWRWMRVTAAPVRDGAGEVVEWFGAAVDVHDQKSAEEQLRQADRQKDEFLAVLAHELRNPLAPIRTSAALLKSLPSPDPLLARSRGIIERQVTHMARLLDDLLDVSRLSRGTLVLRRTRVRLEEVVAAAIEIAAPLIEQRAQVLEVDGLEAAIELEADAARLIQVFGNLLTNASKFSPAQATIAITVRLDQGTAIVVVRDTGAGIPAEHLESVFELFTQVDATRQASSGGLGIGLALTRRLVELHGGTITAASAGPGLGSTLTVRLPAVRAAREAPPRQRTLVAEVSPPRRVLVVDDNADAADTIALLLEGLGCEVHTAYRGEAAVLDAEAFRPDIAIVDLGLPDVDGREVCGRIRSQPWSRDVVMVALTGWGRDADRRSTQLAGFDRHLTKPADPDALLHLIRHLPQPRAHTQGR
ncbi:hypothetical protein TBR22_A09260 [Luteitalea sp. TBR-22]|uniref:hybrid sensor histidine kinase/response regulator n=1 Tax=Luteitalea sp. TBR-22 TaxID=2802971 RepID=UPI001AF4DC21|nr:ATP-binding protein [Luteitalea sp. TBR-22]BCS31723.1 hypothetical protein TBR22_A09260 [Luteitalea sp. TBR-22]